MRTVWKYEVPIQGPQARVTLVMPRHASILHMQLQYNRPCLWVDVWKENPLEERHFEWVGTGNEAPRNAQYIGTALLYSESLVLHLFELK
jgi:hypothetical protein